MISKVQRQSSRFYNDTLRRAFSDVSRTNQVETFRQRIYKERRVKRRNLKWVNGPPLYMAPATPQRREQNVTKTSFWRGLIKKVLG